MPRRKAQRDEKESAVRVRSRHEPSLSSSFRVPTRSAPTPAEKLGTLRAFLTCEGLETIMEAARESEAALSIRAASELATRDATLSIRPSARPRSACRLDQARAFAGTPPESTAEAAPAVRGAAEVAGGAEAMPSAPKLHRRMWAVLPREWMSCQSRRRPPTKSARETAGVPP